MDVSCAKGTWKMVLKHAALILEKTWTTSWPSNRKKVDSQLPSIYIYIYLYLYIYICREVINWAIFGGF